MLIIAPFAPGWPERLLKTCTDDIGPEYHDCDASIQHADAGDRTSALMKQLALRMEITSYSTSFSGIDSPGSAMATLRACLGKQLKKSIGAPKHLYGVETCFA